MRRFAIRLGIPLLVLVLLLVISQFALPPYAEHKVADRLTEHGGQADVKLSAFPALRLLFGHGGELEIAASRLSVDLGPGQEDVFRQLDDFSDVKIDVRDSRAGPFSVSGFLVQRSASHTYEVAISGDGTAGDVARYAADRLGGGFGQALAGLATSALGGFGQRIPFDARMQIVTSEGLPRARNVEGSVAGLPAGPLAQVVANALLSGL
jgi:hypothetical protein